MGGEKESMGTVKNKVLILHGWAYTTDKWGPFLNLLKKSGVDYELLKIPGLTAPIDKPWTLNDYVEWLDKKIENNAVLLGHSNGGRISLAYATAHPKKVKKLILLDSAGIYHNELSIKLKRTFFGVLAKFKNVTASKTFRSLMYKLAGENDYNKATLIMKDTMRHLIETDLTPKLSEVKTPTLIVWGRYDKTTPLSDGKLMHEKIKDSDFRIIEDARHSPQFTKPEEVANAVIDFLKK